MSDINQYAFASNYPLQQPFSDAFERLERPHKKLCVPLFAHHERERASCHRCQNPAFDLRFPFVNKTTQPFPISPQNEISSPSNHVTRQQKVRNTLLDRVLVLAAATHQLATLHARLHQKRVQVLESLRRLVVFRDQNFGFGRLFW
jgi:hypothetical protein